MANKSSVFDMIGPIMIGPSSSHTAGVVRIARAAIRVLGGIPEEAIITFFNSFARTYEGHGSDRAADQARDRGSGAEPAGSAQAPGLGPGAVRPGRMAGRP